MTGINDEKVVFRSINGEYYPTRKEVLEANIIYRQKHSIDDEIKEIIRETEENYILTANRIVELLKYPISLANFKCFYYIFIYLYNNMLLSKEEIEKLAKALYSSEVEATSTPDYDQVETYVKNIGIVLNTMESLNETCKIAI